MLLPVLLILAMLVSLFGMAIPVGAAANSLVQYLTVVPSTTRPDGTLNYTVILTNQNIAGANNATVDLVFYPPGPIRVTYFS